MIDLHNHILAGVDDGAADLEESLAIAQQFLAEGVRSVAATPHLDALNRTGPGGSVVREMVASLNATLDEGGFTLMVLPAQEIFLTPDVPALLDQDIAIPIASGPWVLVELPFNQQPLFFDDTHFRLELAGYRVILAHPERYGFVQRDPGSLDEAIDRGLVLQLTAPSLLGEYGSTIRRTAEALLRAGKYALAASDRHHAGERRSLAALRRRIVELVGEANAELLLETNPTRVIAGRDLEEVEATQVRPRSFLDRILRLG